MKDKVTLVTGASGGLGAFVTRAFLDAGATVIGTSPRIEQSSFSDGNFMALRGEITSLQSATALLDQVASRFGRLDILVHTVGGFAGGKTLANTDDATFQRMLEVNLMVTFHVLRAALPLIRKSGSGCIVGIGSRAAVEPGAKVGAYSASKAAMVSLVRTVAEENKDVGITANVILPGTIDTPANRKEMPDADFTKWVQPAKLAALVVFLASDAGKDINGAVIPMYGKA